MKGGGERRLVLVGGGHAHVQVLRRFAMEPPAGCRLTVVLDTPIAVYSGMVPGFVAGQYRIPELEIDVVPLARRARARVILSAAVAIDPGERRIALDGRPPIAYDLASFDVGSTVAGLDLPGIRQHAFPTRPIGRFVRRVDEIVERARRRPDAEPLRVVVVGGGAAGVELSFCLEHRIRASGLAVAVTLLEERARILPGYSTSVLRRVLAHARARGIEILTERRVAGAAADAVHLEDGERLPCDALIWVTGAVSQPLFRVSGLPTDERGFVLVRSTLQVEGHDELFAVGDCATLIDHPRTPKAGVYAVRQGPVISHNLRAFLSGEPLQAYKPQSDFLTLLNLGDGSALGAKWGLSFDGPWVMRLKDRIDRRFMRRFQVLGSEGSPTAEFRAAPMAGETTMLCGGCAAKVGQTVLDRALERLAPHPRPAGVEMGLSTPDDAAAWTVPGGGRVVASVDAFRAFTDDPYLVGRVAAVNALSDLYAKGVRPRFALALVALPEAAGEEDQEETLFQVLAGARAALDGQEVALIGGHTTTSPELVVGFTVEGFAPADARLLPIDGLREDQALVLTKPLGTGVLFHADMKGLARGPWIQAALASMLRDNSSAAEAALAGAATGATDVTGFGLAGHLGEMVRSAGLSATVEVDALPALPGAVELLRGGVRSTFHPENERARRAMIVSPEAARSPRFELLFDPQTSGGLLFGVAAERADAVVAELVERGDGGAAVVGRVAAKRADGALIEVRRGR